MDLRSKFFMGQKSNTADMWRIEWSRPSDSLSSAHLASMSSLRYSIVMMKSAGKKRKAKEHHTIVPAPLGIESNMN